MASNLDGDVLLNKAYSVIATSFAARSSESHTLQWKDVQILNNSKDNTVHYSISYDRSKQRGKKCRTDNESLISGEVECTAIANYIKYFSDEFRSGNFF